MNTGADPSKALASLLAILAQSTQSSPTSHLQPNSIYPPPRPHHSVSPNAQHIEPVFIEGDVFETTQWIGVPTTPWSEPRKWQFPKLDPDVLARRQLPSVSKATTPIVPEKRKRSVSPPRQEGSRIVSPVVAAKTTFSCYSLAVKYVVQRSEDGEFMEAVTRVQRRQNETETDLWDERQRIIRSFETKRKMNQVLQSLGSQLKNDKVLEEEETAELRRFDEGVVVKWGELVREQEDEMKSLGVPYLDAEDRESKGKMLAFLEDLISAGNE